MYIFYFDCGTSRTRGYLLNDNQIIGVDKRDIGSKDVSLKNDKSILTKAMKSIYDCLLREYELNDSDISAIYASGMITSPYGLIEIPHAVLPMDKIKMKESMVEYYEAAVFKRSIHLILGLKTSNADNSYDNIDLINNVRGEEIEIMGICNHMPEKWKLSKYVVIIPGSHTHSILVEGDTIIDIYSAFSGELFHAITNATILSGSTVLDDGISESQIDMQAINMGCAYLKKYGLARAIYIVHAMKLFNVGDNKKRRQCLSVVVNGAVVESLALNLQDKWKDVSNIVIYGDDNMLLTYKEAIKYFIPAMQEHVVVLNRSKHNCAVEGLVTVLQS